MAKCDEGYLCSVCGTAVEAITESDLYLRYVIGEVDPETLHTRPERHLNCNPVLAQFVDDERFCLQAPVPQGFGRHELDEAYVRERTELVTRGYCRLHELKSQDLPIAEYPLPAAKQKWSG